MIFNVFKMDLLTNRINITIISAIKPRIIRFILISLRYFPVFSAIISYQAAANGSIEGPILINYSQQYNYQLEAKFDQIRKMIAEQQAVDKIEGEIVCLKVKIIKIPSILANVHQLIAENKNLNQEKILPFWREQLKNIEQTLNEALTNSSICALCFASFLAVYREGVETDHV